MKEGTHIPGMAACMDWEAKLTDALDGLLSPEEEAQFFAHKAACPACAGLYEAARKGREWLEFLSPEPEPPAGLFEKILATSGPGATDSAAGLNSDSDRPAAAVPVQVPILVSPVYHLGADDLSLRSQVWQQPGFLEQMRAIAHPRVLMTAAMAFFSIALTLNLAGANLKSFRLADLRPQALRSYMERQLTAASVPVVRYYDHLRFVHEVESRVRELRNENESEDNGYERQQQQKTLPSTPGESRNNRVRGTRDSGEHVTGPREEVWLTQAPLAPLQKRSAPWIA